MQKIDLVSVIITTCNRSNLLCRAIKSVLNQTYTNIEIIIVDDNSIDNTKDIVKKYIEKDKRIIYLRNVITSGANVSRNKGIKSAKGKFIAGLDDDDEFLPNRLELLVKNYDSNYSFITSWNIVIKEDLTKSFRKPPQTVELKDILVNNILMNQGLIEKKRLIEIKGYDEDLSACQDYDLWIRLILKYGHALVLQEYTQIIHEEDNIKRISSPSFKKFKGYFNFFKKYKKHMSLEDKKYWYFKLYTIRNKKISKKLLYKLITKKNEKETTRYYLNTYSLENKYNTIINLFNFINNLDKTKSYILYGYGSMGKLIYPHIRSNIIGIIDNNPNISNLQLKDLKKYPNAIVIITPIIYKEDIINEVVKYTKNYKVLEI